ncbi:hypothetical protein AX15_000807 [Amanita polypyramis BW_CC]|nr:hypothetical protein AX15_000807 [Amanita polypyramis BW_CC]
MGLESQRYDILQGAFSTPGSEICVGIRASRMKRLATEADTVQVKDTDFEVVRPTSLLDLIPPSSPFLNRPRTESSRAFGEAVAPPSQKPCSAPQSEPGSDIEIEQDWEEQLPLPLPTSLSPGGCCPKAFARPRRQPSSTSDNLLTIELQVTHLRSLLSETEGSSFGFAAPALEQLLGHLSLLFLPELAKLVTSMDHVLLHVPSVPKHYGGTGPDPPMGICLVGPSAWGPTPGASTLPAPLPLAPLAPPSCNKPSFAAVVASPAPQPPLPLKLACLCKACMKQGTKLNSFVASALLGDWLLCYAEPLSPKDLVHLQGALDQFHVPGSTVVNWATSASIKFPHVPTIQSDGSLVLEQDLLDALRSNPHWQSVNFIMPPHFIHGLEQALGLSALVFCEVRLSDAPKLGLSTELLPFAQLAAAGVIQPMYTIPASPGVDFALDPILQHCTPLEPLKTPLHL